MHDIRNAAPFRNLTREEIHALPLAAYDGSVHLIRTEDEIEEVFPLLEAETLFGFDTETRPAFKKGERYPTALVQLAGVESVFLFQLWQMPNPRKLLDLLADPARAKIGVGIRQDLVKLTEEWDFEPAGFIDLTTVLHTMGITNGGLQRITASVLGMRVSKRAQTSNWGAKNLLPFQIQYAATDAWLCRRIYTTLIEQKLIPPFS